MTDERPTAETAPPAAADGAADDGQPRFYDLYREPTGITALTEDERAVLRLVNQRVAALPALDDVIDLLFERTAAIFPFDRLGLSFVEEDGRRVVSRYVRATYDRVLLGKGYSEDLRDSSLERVLRNGSPRIIDDLQRYLEEHPASRSTKLLLREGVRSSLTCPLIVEGRVVGFMFRSSRRPGVYTQHHVELQMALTERLSQAVEKAWRIEQLTAANRNYMEMLGFVSHELKNPVASMVTDARILADGYLGPLDDKQKAKLERLITKGEYLLDLVREYLDLARVEGGELQISMQCGVPFVEKVVEPALELVRQQIEAAGMTLATELPASGPADGRLRPVALDHRPRESAGQRRALRPPRRRPAPHGRPQRAPSARLGLERRTGLLASRTSPAVSQVLAPADPDGRPPTGHGPGPVQLLAHRSAPSWTYSSRRPTGRVGRVHL